MGLLRLLGSVGSYDVTAIGSSLLDHIQIGCDGDSNGIVLNLPEARMLLAILSHELPTLEREEN